MCDYAIPIINPSEVAGARSNIMASLLPRYIQYRCTSVNRFYVLIQVQSKLV